MIQYTKNEHIIYLSDENVLKITRLQASMTIQVQCDENLTVHEFARTVERITGLDNELFRAAAELNNTGPEGDEVS